jgi:hypothetical protein
MPKPWFLDPFGGWALKCRKTPYNTGQYRGPKPLFSHVFTPFCYGFTPFCYTKPLFHSENSLENALKTPYNMESTGKPLKTMVFDDIHMMAWWIHH